MAIKKTAKKSAVKPAPAKKPLKGRSVKGGSTAKRSAKKSKKASPAKKPAGKPAAKPAKLFKARMVIAKAKKTAKAIFKKLVKPAAKPVKAIKTVEKDKKPARQLLTAAPITAIPVSNDSQGAQVKRTRKSSKKLQITLPPPPKIDVSNYPKNRVRNILVSQPKPVDPEKNPYVLLGKKHNVNVTFRHFIKVEGLSSQDFRAQRIDIMEHGAVILTSKLSVDHYFKMCNEMRVTVPENMKYFCINEQTAYYLQKYIQYRKRKIFFGHGTILDLVDVIRKNKDEKFLLPVSDVHKEQIVDFLDELQINYTKGVFYKTISADLRDIKNLNEYDVLVFFTPAGIKSLKHNFPNFRQGGTRIAAFGHTAALMIKDLGYRLDVFAPNPQNPSMVGALDAYIREANKR
jgi:uroporphyrinogen-III synthase